jgi:hypothetical protein
MLTRQIFGASKRSTGLKFSRIPFDFGNKSVVSGSDRLRRGTAREEEEARRRRSSSPQPDTLKNRT